jgi:hypothetical protein
MEMKRRTRQRCWMHYWGAAEVHADLAQVASSDTASRTMKVSQTRCKGRTPEDERMDPPGTVHVLVLGSMVAAEHNSRMVVVGSLWSLRCCSCAVTCIQR